MADKASYCVGILWEVIDPIIKNTILRDLIQLNSLCQSNRLDLVIACSKEDLDQALPILRVTRTPDLTQATYWRIYYNKDCPEAPEWSTLSDAIQVEQPVNDGQRLRLDPNFTKEVRYPVYPINETVPWGRTPSKGPADWCQIDF